MNTEFYIGALIVAVATLLQFGLIPALFVWGVAFIFSSILKYLGEVNK